MMLLPFCLGLTAFQSIDLVFSVCSKKHFSAYAFLCTGRGQQLVTRLFASVMAKACFGLC